MGQKKLHRFAEILEFPNVFQYPENMKGNWNNYFKNAHTITLELACGKGEYALGLGRMKPQANFIGVDVKGNRLWKGARTALAENLDNVAFLRTQIDQIEEYFSKDEISEIWITFPDPQLRLSKMKKRLTHPKFLRMYQQFLQADGIIHLKTDSPDLYHFTSEVIKLYELEIVDDTENIYGEPDIKPELKIKTHYEALDIAQSNRIHYLAFRLNKELPLEKDRLLKDIICEKAG
ncbi:MAG: trmB [Chitinophagaceae bacterium]|nr:trmB [Chitinophagaceae bacterium]